MKAGRARPAHRALSGWLLALSSTGLAITAHGLAGGSMPDSALIVPLTALIAWGGAAMAARLRGPVVLIAAVGIVQLALHLLLSQSNYPHGHHGSAALNGWAMFAGHALASVLVALLLARATSGLALFSAAVGWLRGRLDTLWLAPIPAPAATGTVSTVPARPGQLLEILLRQVLARRGPPLGS